MHHSLTPSAPYNHLTISLPLFLAPLPAPVQVEGTFEACMALLAGGEDLSGGAGRSSAAARILAEEE